MTSIPLEAGEVRRFVPPSLANHPTPPTFLLRPATDRERERNERMLLEEGLELHGQWAIREEMLRALNAEWSQDQIAEIEPILREYWDALDQHIKEQSASPFDQRAPFEHPRQKAVETLSDQVMRQWRPLRAMGADNIAFFKHSPTIMACCLVTGWENIDVPFSLAAGAVPVQKMREVADWLKKFERQQAGKIEGVGVPGTAFAELGIEIAPAMYLTEDEEKNSESPSPSSSDQSSSEMDGAEATASSSKGTPSPTTPEA